ncbi:RxLR-like protein [Phytophthora cinnamomi]|uniref:RxLR-like protein n=1 Tax=Phytophthora cinnamomi TaxID=4785 RepID=UPI00355968F3|nr:RxLR-like protein [Phytophthora cinnamomi]
MKSPTSLLLLLLLGLSFVASNGQEDSLPKTEDATSEVATPDSAASEVSVPEPKESSWGRIYLRNGLAPIQYFRDAFGGPMAPNEVSFYFPERDEDRFGCELLPEPELLEIEAANRSAVLVVDRGECTFERKARLADQMGAAALVVVSPSDDVTAPVAALRDEDGEISIASVMIRRTAGDMLRAVAKQTPIYGRLISMTCERKPYTCKPRFEIEENYMETSVARGGLVMSMSEHEEDEDGTRLGSFLAATYGSVIPTRMSFPLATPLDGSQACTDATEDTTTHSQFSGKAVLTPGGEVGQCSEFEKVSNAQRRGASIVLLMQQNNATVMTHPSVEVSWYAYNITVPVLAVSSNTSAKLASLKDKHGDAASLTFAVTNGIADAWELVMQHSQRSAWPKRLKRCSKTLAKLLSQIRGLGGDDEMEAALQNVFINVVGGTRQEWDKAAQRDEDSEEDHKIPEYSSSEKIIQGVKKSQARDEL